MAVSKETKRSIKLYIDNNEIDGSVRSIRSQINKLTREMNALTIGTEKYEEKAKKIADLNAILKSHRENVNHLNTEYSNLKDHVIDVLKTGAGGLISRITGNIFGGFVQRINAAISYSSSLAIEAEGVKIAFDRLNDPSLLDNLRKATHGTVDDLTLMQQVVKFKDFNLPVEQLGTYLAYAQQKAKDTGQDINYLVDSIVTGLGRQSPQILDNLGLSAKQISEEAKKSGDFFGAVAKIVEENMAAAGDYVETTSDRAARANAELKNAQMELGQALLEMKEAGASALGSLQTKTIQLLTWVVKHRGALLQLAAAALLAYTWHIRSAIALKANLLATKLHTAATIIATTAQKAWTSATILANYAVTLFTRGLGALRVQMALAKMEGAAMAWGPMALAITGVGLAVYGLIKAFSSSTDAMERQSQAMKDAKAISEAWRDVQNDAAKTAATQKQKIEELTRIIGDNTVALDTRYKAAKQLENIVPGYVASLNTEKGALDSNSKAIDNYIARLDRLALARAVYKKLEELASKAIDADMAVQTWERAVARREKIIEERRKRQEREGFSTSSGIGSSATGYSANYGMDSYLYEQEGNRQILEHNKERLGYWNSEQHAIAETRKALHRYLNEHTTAEERLQAMNDSWDTPAVQIGGGSGGSTGKGKGGGSGNGGHTETEEERLQKELKAKLEAIEVKSQQRMAELKEMYYKGDIESEEEYNLEKNRIQRTAVEETLALAGLEPKKRAEMLDRLLELQMEFGRQYSEIRDEELEKERERLEKGNADFAQFAEQWKKKEEARANHAIEKNKEMADKIASITQQMGTSLGETLGKLFQGEKGAWRDFLRDMLVTLIDALEKMMAAYYASILAKEIASKGWLGVASAAAQMALITAAFEAAKAVAKSFDVGGFTGSGAWNEPKGVVHANEFVANRFATRNRQILPVLNLIDAAQKSGSVSRLTSSDIAAVLPSVGGAGVQGSRRNARVSAGQSDTAMMATMSRLSETVEKLKSRLDKPITAETYVTGRGGSHEAGELYNRMRNNVSRRTQS